jgi:hypothetical protein
MKLNRFLPAVPGSKDPRLGRFIVCSIGIQNQPQASASGTRILKFGFGWSFSNFELAHLLRSESHDLGHGGRLWLIGKSILQTGAFLTKRIKV